MDELITPLHHATDLFTKTIFKMKWLVFLQFTWIQNIYSQDKLNFAFKDVECENKWIVSKTTNDTLMKYGFIYIDSTQGLMLDYYGIFSISKSGKYSPQGFDKTRGKFAINPNENKLAILPASKYAELNISQFPAWFNPNSRDTNSVEHLYRWGFLYNGFGECKRALTYLERAKKLDPNFSGLTNELGFAYNCLEDYPKALAVLLPEINNNLKDPYFLKEVVRAYTKVGQFEDACKVCSVMLSNCVDTQYNAEVTYTLIHNFYLAGDKKRFRKWLGEAKKWNSAKPDALESIKTMESEMN